jgi:hypothetical protein
MVCVLRELGQEDVVAFRAGDAARDVLELREEGEHRAKDYRYTNGPETGQIGAISGPADHGTVRARLVAFGRRTWEPDHVDVLCSSIPRALPARYSCMFYVVLRDAK